MSASDFTITSWSTQSIGVLELSGTLFLPDVPRVMARITAVLQATPHAVAVVDVSRLAAPATDTILTLFPAVLRRSGGWPHAALHLAAPGPDLNRRLRAVRMQRYLPVHATLDDALTCAGRDVATERHEVSLPPDPACLPTARAAARDLWPDAERRQEEAVLVVNELAANAIQHVAQPFTLSLSANPWQVLVAVTDASPQEPIVRPPRGTATNGRGMQLVARLSEDWGVRLVHPRGKTVWATMPASPQPMPHGWSSGIG